MKTFVLILLCLALLVGTTVYYCPRCGGTDIQRVCTDPIPEQRLVSMDELGHAVTFTPAVMFYSHYKATCRGCGYTKEYTIP
jgi:hypothetical protein